MTLYEFTADGSRWKVVTDGEDVLLVETQGRHPPVCLPVAAPGEYGHEPFTMGPLQGDERGETSLEFGYRQERHSLLQIDIHDFHHEHSDTGPMMYQKWYPLPDTKSTVTVALPAPMVLIDNVCIQDLQPTLSEIDTEFCDVGRVRGQPLYELSPRGFERLVASILANHGYKVTLTKYSKDGGYDVLAVAERRTGGDLRLIVECKRYRFDRPVGVSVVRELWGVIMTPGATYDRGIIATTSRFSHDASELLAQLWGLSGWDMKHIMKLLECDWPPGGLWTPAL